MMEMECRGSFQSRNVLFIQECHPYTGNLNSEKSGDSTNALLHCGDVLGVREVCQCKAVTKYTLRLECRDARDGVRRV